LRKCSVGEVHIVEEVLQGFGERGRVARIDEDTERWLVILEELLVDRTDAGEERTAQGQGLEDGKAEALREGG